MTQILADIRREKCLPQGIDHTFQQTLDRRHIRNLKVHVGNTAFTAFQRIHKKPSDRIAGANGIQSLVKESRLYDEVNTYILSAALANGVYRLTVHQQNIPCR